MVYNCVLFRIGNKKNKNKIFVEKFLLKWSWKYIVSQRVTGLKTLVWQNCSNWSHISWRRIYPHAKKETVGYTSHLYELPPLTTPTVSHFGWSHLFCYTIAHSSNNMLQHLYTYFKGNLNSWYTLSPYVVNFNLRKHSKLSKT